MGRKTIIAMLVVLFALLVLGVIVWRIHKERLLLRKDGVIVGSLRLIRERELLFRKNVKVDQDRDGIGEFAWLNEMVGSLPPRRADDGSPPAPISPTYIASIYVALYYPKQDVVCAERHPCSVVVFLPYPEKGGMDDRVLDGRSDARAAKWSTPLDPAKHGDIIDLQEKHFVLYAVPRRHRGAFQDPSCPGFFLGQDSFGRHAKECPSPALKATGPQPSEIRGRCTYVINEKGDVHYTKMEHRGYLWPYWHVTDYRAARSPIPVVKPPLWMMPLGAQPRRWSKLPLSHDLRSIPFPIFPPRLLSSPAGKAANIPQ
ncbi:MAG: hypothetical protein AB1696_18165 [Planctomycetota bacterium]